MTTTKQQKDKPYALMPRLTPRPTAASAARAARNATNRNLVVPPSQRQSPARNASPVSSKLKTAVSCNGQKSNSKTEIKINRNSENEFQISECEISNAQEIDTCFTKEIEFIAAQDIPQDNTGSTDGCDGQEIHNTEILIIPEIPNLEDNYDAMNMEPVVIERKHPPTPSLSRPQTPRSVSSRPQTPHPLPRTSAPCSRPNTPQRNTPPTRTRTPSTPVPAISRPVTPVATHPHPAVQSNVNYEELKSTYTAKREEFHRLKKELDLKQLAVLEVYEGLCDIQSKMPGERGSEERDLVVFNVADWARDEVSKLCRDAAASSITDGAAELFNTTVSIDEGTLDDAETRTLNIPGCFAELCFQAFKARQELSDWIKQLLENNQKISDVEVMDQLARYNTQGLQLFETLYELKAKADEAVYTVTLISKRAYRERSTLVAVGESLVREVARLRQDLETRTATAEEIREIRIECNAETNKALEEVRRELDEERSAKTAMKEKLANTESQLRQTRMRISKMDKQLRESEASIASLTGTVKSLEDQSRQREVHLESRARKLKESLKTGELASTHLAQQRDSLQIETNYLKEQVQTITAQHKSEIQDLNNQIKDLKSFLEENKNSSQNQCEENHNLKSLLDESKQQIEELKSKITELENSKPNPDLPTEREMDLWAELQATKDTLRIAEDEITACKREKTRFLETLTKIAESEDKVGMQQKLSAELLSKEEILGKMQIQIRELTKNIKHNEQKVIQYEQYVRDIQAHNRALANCKEAPNGISYEDLQQEIMNLKMNLLESVHRNEELTEILIQKEQQLEHQDKTSRGQARVIKVREELINMLKNKETEQSRHLTALEQDLEHRMRVVDEVNKQIAAKADEIQELFGTLETKQQQIHRLEKIVLALEEQQRRAQAQRTRHEEKIAALEHELLASGTRRERRFLFF